MPKTAVGLFEHPGLVDDVVREKVRNLKEPAAFEVTGVMSFPHLDFEVDCKLLGDTYEKPPENVNACHSQLVLRSCRHTAVECPDC